MRWEVATVSQIATFHLNIEFSIENKKVSTFLYIGGDCIGHNN